VQVVEQCPQVGRQDSDVVVGALIVGQRGRPVELAQQRCRRPSSPLAYSYALSGFCACAGVDEMTQRGEVVARLAAHQWQLHHDGLLIDDLRQCQIVREGAGRSQLIRVGVVLALEGFGVLPILMQTDQCVPGRQSSIAEPMKGSASVWSAIIWTIWPSMTPHQLS